MDEVQHTLKREDTGKAECVFTFLLENERKMKSSMSFSNRLRVKFE